MSIEDYIRRTEEEYIGEISCHPQENEREIQDKIPVQMKELYKKYDGISFPFGMIYSAEEALEMSLRSPFAEEKWFCFGQDYFFTFWLCKTDIAKGLPSFTIWDHDGGSEIGEPIFYTLEELLDDAKEEYNSGETDEYIFD